MALRRFLYYAISIIVLIIFLRTQIFNLFISYEIKCQNPVPTLVVNRNISEQLNFWKTENKEADLKERTDYTKKIIKTSVSYDTSQTINILEDVLQTQKASKYGLTNYFAAIMAFLIKDTDLEKQYEIQCVETEWYFLNYRIADYGLENLTQKYPIVVIKDKNKPAKTQKKKKKILIDPFMYKTIRINKFSERKKENKN